MNAYEMRLEMWRTADAFLRDTYKHQKEQYEAGLIQERPAFPTYEDVIARAHQMKRFVSDD